VVPNHLAEIISDLCERDICSVLKLFGENITEGIELFTDGVSAVAIGIFPKFSGVLSERSLIPNEQTFSYQFKTNVSDGKSSID